MNTKSAPKANYAYMASITPKTIIDKLLLTIWKGGLNNQTVVSLNHFIPIHSQQIHLCLTSGYIKHQSDGYYFLTKVGQARLESAYKKLPANHNFTIEEVQ